MLRESELQSKVDDKVKMLSADNAAVSEEEEQSFLTKAQGVWVKVFSIIPYGRILFGSYKVPASVKQSEKWETFARKKAPDVRVRGLWNLLNIVDALFFGWSKYLDDDPDVEDEDIKDQIKSDCQNIGLLAALVSTICFSMFILGTEDENFDSSVIGKLYIFFWNGASLSTLMSTAACVLLIMAVDESSGVEETAYFVALLNTITFGLGTLTPLILLYFGLVCMVAGLFLALVKFFTLITILISLGAVCFVGCIFVLFYLNMVAALKCAREIKQTVSKNSKKVSLKFEHIKALLKQYMQEKGYNSADDLDTFSDFLTFIEMQDYEDIKCSGDTLRHASVLRAKTAFEGFIKANIISDEITIDNYDMSCMRQSITLAD